MLRNVQFLLQLVLEVTKRHRDYETGVELENQQCLNVVTQQSNGSTTSRGQLQDLLEKGYVHDSTCCTGSWTMAAIISNATIDFVARIRHVPTLR